MPIVVFRLFSLFPLIGNEVSFFFFVVVQILFFFVIYALFVFFLFFMLFFLFVHPSTKLKIQLPLFSFECEWFSVLYD